MSITRFSKILLVVLALALLAGTASAQVNAGTATLNFSYTKGAATATQTDAITDGGGNTAYTNSAPVYDSGSGSNQWLTVTGFTGAVPESLTLGLSTAAANLMAPGSTYSATITLTGVTDGLTATITVNLTINSPLAAGASSSNATLVFVKSGTGSQPLAATQYTVTNSDAVNDSYSVSKNASCTVAGADLVGVLSVNGDKATSTSSDTLTLSIDPTNGAAASLGTVNGCIVTLKYLGVVFKTVNLTLTFISAPLASSKASLPLTYTKGGGGTNSGTTSISVTAGFPNNSAFAVDPATVPGWLGVTATSWVATTGGGVTVTLAINTAVAATMATGNYTATVGFYTGVYRQFGNTTIAVPFSISNTAPSIGIKEGTTEIDNNWAYGAAHPTMTVTPFSNNEPMPFTASCSVTVTSSYTYTPTSSSCLLNASQATVALPLTGVAYTWGFGMAVTLDSAIYAYPIGTTVLVTVTVNPTGGGSAMSLAYGYTFHPIDPGQITISPTSVAQIATSTSMTILVTGSNFVGTQNIANLGGPNSVLPTQVYLNNSTTALSASLVQVLGPTQMLVTIPQASFLQYAANKTSVALAIGVANETGSAPPAGQKVFANLTITNNPVVYAMTSTATYINPGLGVNPSIAPYELVSIFGDNFGYKGITPNFQTATLNSYKQVPTSLYITTVSGKAVNLSVSFKDGSKTYAAPILFANQNQINLIVPSGLTVSDTVYVTVTSGATTNSSDGAFAATVVAADPGVFTMASDGTGPGAILNHDYSVNMSGNAEHIGQFVQIYMTGLGAPDSTAPDVGSTTTPAAYPTTCALINGTSGSPGYLQVAMTKAGNNPTPPTGWTNIDGVVINPDFLKQGIAAPCMTDNITVTFDAGGAPTTATTTGGGVLWAGFSLGSVAGLYQINVTIPPGTTTGATVPVTVTINGHTSPPVTLAVQ